MCNQPVLLIRTYLQERRSGGNVHQGAMFSWRFRPEHEGQFRRLVKRNKFEYYARQRLRF